MAKKRLAPGIFRRCNGEIFIIAKAWGHSGKREKTLPADTELIEAFKVRNDLISEIKGSTELSRSSLTFHHYVEHYQKNAGDHARNSLVDHIDRDLGHLPIQRVADAWGVFIDRQERRNRNVYRRVDGKLVLVDTGKPLSGATVKAYKRYFKAICRYAMTNTMPKHIRLREDDDPSAGMKIGKAEQRRRPITPRERTALLDAAERLYPWFVPVLQFASTMPIRPEDQCSLKWNAIDELHGQIPYLPNKTRKTGTYAYPLILPHLQDFILGRIGDAECQYVFYAVSDDGRREQLTYSRIHSAWLRVTRAAGISGLRFYDLRHDAVSYCLNAGFTTRDVMAFAGWNSAEMVDGYDTRDRIRLAERAREIMGSGNLDNYNVHATVHESSMRGVKTGENLVFAVK